MGTKLLFFVGEHCYKLLSDLALELPSWVTAWVEKIEVLSKKLASSRIALQETIPQCEKKVAQLHAEIDRHLASQVLLTMGNIINKSNNILQALSWSSLKIQIL